MTLKLVLPPWGLDSNPVWVPLLAEHTGLAVPDVRDCLNELETGGWIKRHDTVLWLVDGFAYEPTWKGGSPTQARMIQRHLAGLPTTFLVPEFLARYAEWFHRAEVAEVKWQANKQQGDTRRRLGGKPAKPTSLGDMLLPKDTLSDTLSDGVSDTPRGVGSGKEGGVGETTPEWSAIMERLRPREP